MVARLRSVPFLLILLVALLVGACSAGPAATPTLVPVTPVPSTAPTAAPTPAPTEAPAFPATLTDDEGATVVIPAEPARIVSLTPAVTETLFALGVGDRLVGKVEDVSLFPPEAASVPDVAKFGSVDVEKILALGTDLVIAGGSGFNPVESITKLRALGVPVLVIFAPDLETTLADMNLIGRAVGRPDEAARLVADIQAAFDEVAAATASQPTLRVFYETSDYQGYWGFAPDYVGTEMVRIAGGDPITSGTPGVYQVQAEQIVAFDPEVILLGDAAYGVTVDAVGKRPGWDVLTAVKSGNVRPIDDVIVTRTGPRLADGIRALALAINPDLVLPSTAP
ncbi:MAG: ABC transporter substrate-binding protein [Candidatus Limnocylindrales bacterium]